MCLSTGRSSLDFMSQFVEEFGGPHPGFAMIPARPPAGQNAILRLIVTGVDTLFEVKLSLVSANGELLRNASVSRLSGSTYLARVSRLPDVPFILLLTGQESDGQPFQRQSTTQIQASQLTLQVQNSVVMVPGQSIIVPFTVDARGIEGVTVIRVQDDQGFVREFDASLTLNDVTGNATGQLSLSIPTGTPPGTSSVVTLEAESTTARQSNFALLRASVIREVIDLTPPVCRVVNESLDCPALCGNATWQVTLLMTDGNGTGLQDPRISVTIPDTPFNETSTSIITDIKDENGFNATLLTFSASCCVTAVEISAVDKEANVGRCDFSIRRPSTSTEPPQITHNTTTARPNSSTISTTPTNNLSTTHLNSPSTTRSNSPSTTRSNSPSTTRSNSPSTTVSIILRSTPSHSPRLTVSLWTSLLLLALTALLL
ncbi:cell wall protein DAN4-like [Astyanax mexicanus]|uniref:Cell wall protein DAN4-like n=1 Tax=Astyanax mexicanus TaxID=7994 RepID=A0A8T2LMW8_ASTMX|nr:cell wall protein DAN4-like [Astyanax mexicanus]